jgi:hypothetical protein
MLKHEASFSKTKFILKNVKKPREAYNHRGMVKIRRIYKVSF